MEILDIKQLKEYIYLAGQKFEQQFLGKIFDNLTKENLFLLDRILDRDNDEDNEVIGLAELKEDIARVKVKNIQRAITKIRLVEQIRLPDSIIEAVDRKVLLMALLTK